MTDRKTHELIDKIFLKKSYGDVHTLMDVSTSWQGSKHRKLWVLHHPLASIGFAIAKKDVKAGLSCLLHIATDEIGTAIKKGIKIK